MSARHRPWMVVAAIALAGCSSVPWEDYDPSVKETIDRMAKAGGCPGLQEQFDIADQNNEATMARTGHNNADLMDYIYEAMRDAGCY